MSTVSGQAEIIEIKKTLKDLSGAVKGINAKLQHINQNHQTSLLLCQIWYARNRRAPLPIPTHLT